MKTPREYYEEGNWNWNTFQEVAKKMTLDTNGDGEMDIYGFGWWDSFWVQMLNANGQTNILYGEDGTIKSNFLTSSAMETFQFMQKGYVTDPFIKAPNGAEFIDDFKNGKLAMTCEYGFAAITAYACDYEIGWAPLPVGPSGEEFDCGGSMTGFSIPVTSANPEGAVAFARMAYELLLDYNRRQRIEQYGLQEVDLMNNLSKNINFATIGIEKYWDAQWTIFESISTGADLKDAAKRADAQIKEGAELTLNKK